MHGTILGLENVRRYFPCKQAVYRYRKIRAFFDRVHQGLSLPDWLGDPVSQIGGYWIGRPSRAMTPHRITLIEKSSNLSGGFDAQ